MTQYDPNTNTDNATATHRTTYVRRTGSATPWVLAAIVAVVAIIAVAFLMTRNQSPTQDEMAAAMDSSRAAGYVEGATTAMNSGAGAVASAANDAASRTASEAADAAADARAAAEQAASSASDAASNASDRVRDEAVITEPVQ